MLSYSQRMTQIYAMQLIHDNVYLSQLNIWFHPLGIAILLVWRHVSVSLTSCVACNSLISMSAVNDSVRLLRLPQLPHSPLQYSSWDYLPKRLLLSTKK